MKQALTFGLEQAGWPVLLVTSSGAILRANPCAAETLALPGGEALLNQLWASENSVAAGDLLSQARHSPAPALVKLRLKAGGCGAFHARIGPATRDASRQFLLQLFPESSPASAPAPSKGKPGPAPPPADAAPPDTGQAHKQKLDCALQLARTVALDFNNALTSILGHTSLMLSRMKPDSPWRGSLVEIEKSAGRAAEIAADLAAFSRQEKDASAQGAGNLNELLRRTLNLFQTPAHQHVVWGMQLEPRLCSALFDEAKMQQAFLKILENAVQAIDGGGHVIIRTRNHQAREPEMDGNAQLAPGSYICAEFQDNGCGIAVDVLPRIFEPFFTTKKTPLHRGLGLAWVYGIVTNHGGCVAVNSQSGAGTSVRVYLPAQRKIVRDQHLHDDELGGAETILMIDDEELLLTMAETVLSAYGYRVLTATSGARGMEIFEKIPDQIDLVITDLVMPQMSGREVMEQLRRASPELRILCTSGYVRAGGIDESEVYLQKPFTAQDLLRKVRQALARTEAGR